MRTITNSQGVETLIFAETIEDEALDQIRRLCNLGVYSQSTIRVMPDAHAGKGCTIGTTMTIGAHITPNLVGVDIGCGMLTIALRDPSINLDQLDSLVRTAIPHGFNTHRRPVEAFDLRALRCQRSVDLARAALSIGTLGGGNHFIEVGRSAGGQLHLIIHSGSRKLGAEICQHYQDKAIAQLAGSGAPKASRARASARPSPIPRELAYLAGQDFHDYMNDMAIAQRYASANRAAMARAILHGMGLAEADRFETIHNYIDFRRMILRKGAVSAEQGERLLIPINMRDGALLCLGKGNGRWNYSAPHGAGRLMSRSKAKEQIALDDYLQAMQGVYTTTAGRATLDEAPQAYRPMDEIQRTITETAQVVDTIRPIYNFKAQ